MLKSSRLAAIIAAALAASPSADAQQASGRRPERVNLAGSETENPPGKGDPELHHLLLSRPVQREIRLTDEQAERLGRLYSSLGDRSRKVLLEYRSTQAPEKKAEAWSRLAAVNDEFAERIKAELDRWQAKRLEEVAIRNAGLRALLMPRVADALDLTRDQRRALEQALPALQPMGMSHLDADAKAERARAEVARILKREQLEEFGRLGGTPFDSKPHPIGN